MASLIYYYIFTLYFGFETPKKLALKREEGELINKLELLSNRFREANKTLLVLQMRDNYVYRPIFGMEEISSEVRNAGFGGKQIFVFGGIRSQLCCKVCNDMDVLYKKTFIQSKSFDDVFQLAKNADEMSFCVPAISPVNITARRIRFYSFGYRPDPFTGSQDAYMNLSGPVGEPIYATGNGRVVEIDMTFMVMVTLFLSTMDLVIKQDMRIFEDEYGDSRKANKKGLKFQVLRIYLYFFIKLFSLGL